ncbi:HAMP domain-containing sensor histidine kinase [Mucilaginibacter phyllosphaerae]|uniref:histidine kinase n=1 Tax=Mucilaginibacter phyllosphaerae TaxID=1812349 RepID=A0A4Y8AL49_9SPHI|nr:HAMP domain-containing sensor histidine kinase [Mucilaginibacter phyllosphaerae]MBB3967631.1 signal transduction histidine kinase [Mucilaginibacter phyllosphaerae]TEW69312.1 HAMP domain-containing histidine kinase [Mucilaginibacter phyllosphaerae]GGH21828.1 two-component sensor histidine kinase [Mucilaginibacter phyllosphaerae]
MKLQTKITLLFVVISTIGLVLLNASIFYFVSDFNFEDFFKRLEARVNLTAETNIHPDKESAAYKQVRLRYLEKLANEQEFIIKLDTAKKPSYSKAVNLPDEFYQNILTNKKARFTQQNHFYAGRLFNIQGEQYIVIVTANDPYGFKELAQLKRVLIIIFFIFILLTYIAGKIFSYYTLQPVRGIIKRVKNISANNLHMRLDEVKGKDEIAELVLTFNNMLTRLETAFETQNNFVSNASHELRTPLTIISGETQLLLKGNKVTDAGKESVQTILTEVEKLGHILASLLGLAQTGFDGKKQNWQKIRVDELVMGVADSVRKIDRESVIDIDFSTLPDDESLLYTEGNINLLQLAISNILLNACKYSSNRPVTVQVTAQDGRVIIKVSDKGIGIPQQEQQYIFEPFFRASNTGDFKGHGIGLPLTLNIIRLHKGSIGIRSEEQVGTEIQILLPAV